MKYLSLFLLTLSLMFGSCSNNDEPALAVALPISGTFIPGSIELDLNQIDEAQKRNIFHLVNNMQVVNDISQLPDDPMGFSPTYYEIDFNECTLLIKYILHDYTVDTYSNRYFRNTTENSYNWTVIIGTNSDTYVDKDDLYLTRFAIIVKKIPSDAQVKSWFSLTSLGKHPNNPK